MTEAQTTTAAASNTRTWGADYAAAFVNAQAAMKSPHRNRTVKVRTKAGAEYTFDYATLDSILDEVRPVLAASHLAVTFRVAPARVTCRLLHTSGQYDEVDTELILGKDCSMQDYGGALTYSKRYALTAILGISADEDDDGSGASGHQAQTEAKSAPKHEAQQPKAEPATTTRHDPATAQHDRLGSPQDEVVFGEVREKRGQSKGKLWVLFSSKASDGNWYGTFSATHADIMTASHNQDVPVLVAWKPGRKEGARDIVDIAAPPALHTNETPPEAPVADYSNAPF